MNACHVFDRIHGKVNLPPLVAAIASTPEFSRLDDIRQLGGCSFVFPSATHTRREHSIGVCHLAGLMVKHLQTQRPDLVDADDVLCVQLAGLLHDLGHGPFSHLFEAYVHTYIDPSWSHEEFGLRLLDAILAAHPEIELAVHFKSGTVTQHLAFVRLLVLGLAPQSRWPDVGRPETKRFLAGIVHNRDTGIDVDKLDYLLRDSLAVFGSTNTFDVSRLVGASRLVVHDGAWKIAYDESVAHELVGLYTLRARLHHKVYQHRAVTVVEALLSDLLCALDTCLPDGDKLRDILADPMRFATLTDAWVLAQPYRNCPALAPARTAYTALYQRPWLTRIPLTVCLRTSPGCAKCGVATGIMDAFCAQCGASTRDRMAILNDEKLLIPPECAITNTEATQEVLARLPNSSIDVRVHITDVHCGAAVVTQDSYGRLWRDYDPLRSLVFCTRDGKVLRLRPASFAIPEARHVRTAHCYLAKDAPPADVETAGAAFAAWAATVGEVAERRP